MYFSAALPAGASSGSTRCDRSVTAAVQAALREARRSHMAIGPTTEAKRSRKGTGNEADLQTAAQEDLKSDLAYLQQQVHGLRSRFHGELGVLALRIEDNERLAMKRRKMARRWAMVAVVAVCLWLGSKGVRSMLDGPFLLPGLALVGLTLLGGITLLLLNLHNDADEREHRDRHHNWFRLTVRDDPSR